MFWGPAHCIGRFDFNRPKCSAPYLAIIGDQTNITDEMSQLYMGIKSTQKDTKGTFALPNYEMVHYNSAEEMDDFISSPDYKTNCNGRKSTTKGICWGL